MGLADWFAAFCGEIAVKDGGTIASRYKLNGDQYFVPSPRLVWNALGDGAYFTLFDSYKGSQRKKFSQFYGEFFEQYVRRLLQEAYSDRSDSTTVTPLMYFRKPGHRVESSDLIITERNDVIFVEVVAKRLNLVSSIVNLNLQSIESDIRRGILCKAKQLHDNIEDYKAGTLLPQHPRSKGQRLFPVIVSPKNWPRIQILTSFWPEEQRQKGLLTGAEPLEILDADEIELLQPMLMNGILLGELLDRKNNPPPGHESNRLQSMHDYLVLRESGLLSDESPTRKRGEAIGAELIEMVNAWA